MTRTILTSSLLGSAVLLLSSAASAGGVATARFGAEAGHPTTFNPASIYYNPAGVAGQ